MFCVLAWTRILFRFCIQLCRVSSQDFFRDASAADLFHGVRVQSFHSAARISAYLCVF
jgi:hypothetical protein